MYSGGQGLDPSVRQHFFVDIGHEIIYMAILFTSDSSRAIVSYWQKDVYKVLVNRFGLSLQEKVWIG